MMVPRLPGPSPRAGNHVRQIQGRDWRLPDVGVDVAWLATQPMQFGDFEDLVRNGRRMEPAAPHILAQMIGHSPQSMEPRGWRGWCCRCDTGGGRERFLRIPYRR